ncbi:MAG: serine/threonine protein kinase [Myxococcales bacterium]|nr:serine/threonine protein kinase [Myxococcales bacterium]
MRTLGEIQPGQTVGRYEFLVPIAQGGMAAVWAARLKGTRGFTKTVAVKTMLPTISDNPHFEQMFLDEAQLASRIRHPNVVEILDLGEQDDLLYLVMEWVDGEPLSSIRRIAAKREGVPRPIAVKIVQDTAAGLHAAHELKDESGGQVGLVHRDISPQNVLITFDGVVKIVDFGVAKAAGRTVEHTNSGQIKGKPPYMSPEQALGKEIDRRTDIFALGIILYQLTTGKHPFRGENDMITLQNIVSDRPIIPPRAYDKEYPKPLEAVVMKALDRDPDKRFQTTAELEAALDRVFPPTVARVRTEDVGKFVTAMLGDRGNERRAALKEAVRVADERAASSDSNTNPGRMPELGTRVGVLPYGAPSSPDNARQSVTGITGPTPHSGAFARPSVPEFTSSAMSAPETPFGTQVPADPLPQKKKGGAVWVVGGLLVAAVLVGGALVLTRTLKHDAAAAVAPPVIPPPVSATADTTQPAPSSQKPDESGAIDLSQLAVEKGASKQGAGRPLEPKEKDPKEKDPKEKDPKEKDPKKPVPKTGTGFVPPPVTDPGF